MSDFDEAMKMLAIPDDANSRTKLRGVCQWILGDTEWADQFMEWAEESGFTITEGGSNEL